MIFGRECWLWGSVALVRLKGCIPLATARGNAANLSWGTGHRFNWFRGAWCVERGAEASTGRMRLYVEMGGSRLRARLTVVSPSRGQWWNPLMRFLCCIQSGGVLTLLEAFPASHNQAVNRRIRCTTRGLGSAQWGILGRLRRDWGTRTGWNLGVHGTEMTPSICIEVRCVVARLTRRICWGTFDQTWSDCWLVLSGELEIGGIGAIQM